MESTRNFSNCSVIMSQDTINTLDKYYSQLEQRQFGFWKKAGKAALVAGGVLGAAYLGDQLLNGGQITTDLGHKWNVSQMNRQVTDLRDLATEAGERGDLDAKAKLEAKADEVSKNIKVSEAKYQNEKAAQNYESKMRENPYARKVMEERKADLDKKADIADANEKARVGKLNAVRNEKLKNAAEAEDDANSWGKGFFRDSLLNKGLRWLGGGVRTTKEVHDQNTGKVNKYYPEAHAKLAKRASLDELYHQSANYSAIAELQGIVRHFSETHPEVQLFSLATIADLMYSGSIQDKHFNNFRKKYNF